MRPKEYDIGDTGVKRISNFVVDDLKKMSSQKVAEVVITAKK